jgi:murein L,D-transpeptidase YafK
MGLPMTASSSLSFIRVSCAVLAVAIAGLIVYAWGGALWHPLFAKLNGQYSVGDRIADIAKRQPDLDGMRFSNVSIVVYKQPRMVRVYNNGVFWEECPMTAWSGNRGPKLKEGDGQIPEGIYHVEALNPNSSYYLSLRVSYPNDDDRRRSSLLGIADLGGDIYIHGKNASIGCIAIGDHAIERLFYAVEKSGYAHVSVVIAPQIEFDESLRHSAYSPLYENIYREIARLR